MFATIPSSTILKFPQQTTSNWFFVFDFSSKQKLIFYEKIYFSPSKYNLPADAFYSWKKPMFSSQAYSLGLSVYNQI